MDENDVGVVPVGAWLVVDVHPGTFGIPVVLLVSVLVASAVEMAIVEDIGDVGKFMVLADVLELPDADGLDVVPPVVWLTAAMS